MDYKEKVIALLKSQELSKEQKEKLENIFPELKELGDEKIRKDIIWCLKHSGIKESNPINPHVTTITKDAIAWLEKQGVQKLAEWHREDKQNLNACLGYIQDEFLRRWLTDIIHTKYDNPARSEEDEAKIVKLKSFIAQCNGFNKENRNKVFDLIDSIKPRCAWKPSDEQLKALNAINVTGCISYAGQGQELINLYQDLKKLREE